MDTDPTAAYPGKQPIAKVGKAIKNILIVKAFLDPNLSPIYPIITPPIGLMKKAPPNTAKLSIIAACPS